MPARCLKCGLRTLAATEHRQPGHRSRVRWECPCGWAEWGEPPLVGTTPPPPKAQALNRSKSEPAIGWAASAGAVPVRETPEPPGRSTANPTGLGIEMRPPWSPQTAALPRPVPDNPLSFTTILCRVCRLLDVKPEMLAASGRHRVVVLARTLVVAACRRSTILSFPDIQRAMGRPNHSTCVTMMRRFEEQAGRRIGELVGAYRVPEHALPMTLAEAVAFVTGTAAPL